MARIVIASAAEASREQLSRLLVSSGFSIFRCCAAGSELRRTLNECEDGVVTLTDIMGREERIEGEIASADLTGGTVVVRPRLSA